MLVRLDPTRTAKERRIAELERCLEAPPQNNETATAIRYHVHYLFCRFSAFLHDKEKQEGVKEVMRNTIQGVPIWAIERAVAAQHRASPPSRYPPSASTFFHSCQSEMTPVRAELFRLRGDVTEKSQPAEPRPTEPRLAQGAARANIKHLFSDLADNLRRNDAEQKLTTVSSVIEQVIEPIGTEDGPAKPRAAVINDQPSPSRSRGRKVEPVPKPPSAVKATIVDRALPKAAARSGTEG